MATQTKESIEVKHDWSVYDHAKHTADRKEAIESACLAAREKNSDALVGKVVRWPVADGYAEYMILSEAPLVLQHIADYDGYRVEVALIRGLRLRDVEAMVAFDKLFG